MTTTYGVWKFLHVLGVVLLVGNVTATAVWKVFANRSRDPRIVAFAQRLVAYTDWSLTLGGVVLIVVGGYGMLLVLHLDPRVSWIFWGRVLFALSGAVWLLKLVPIQIAQARLVNRFDRDAPVDEAYWSLCRRWIFWGAVATIPLVVSTYLMVMKP